MPALAMVACSLQRVAWCSCKAAAENVARMRAALHAASACTATCAAVYAAARRSSRTLTCTK